MNNESRRFDNTLLISTEIGVEGDCLRNASNLHSQELLLIHKNVHLRRNAMSEGHEGVCSTVVSLSTRKK